MTPLKKLQAPTNKRVIIKRASTATDQPEERQKTSFSFGNDFSFMETDFGKKRLSQSKIDRKQVQNQAPLQPKSVPKVIEE